MWSFIRSNVCKLWRGVLWLATLLAIGSLIFYAYWGIQSMLANQRMQVDTATIQGVAFNDQLDRFGATLTPVGLIGAFTVGAERDAVRRAEVRQIEERGVLQTADDYTLAALVFQHGATPDDYLQANQYAEQAMDLGSDRARRMYAMTRDRYLLSIDEPQQFGTQYTLEDSQWKLQPYDPQTTDAERAAYDVAPLAQISTGLTGSSDAGPWDRVQMALFNPLTILLVQLLVLIGTIRLVWMGLRWPVRRRKQQRAERLTTTTAPDM